MKSLFFFLFLGVATCVFAQSCDGSLVSPCIVLDNESFDEPLMSFRRIDALGISASAAPSRVGLLSLLHEIPKSFKHVLILDLRQESHLYVNGMNINLTTVHNWINQGKSLSEINHDEQLWLLELNNEKKISYLTPNQFIQHLYDQETSLPIYDIHTEEEEALALGFSYMRIPVQDHCWPMDDLVDKTVALFDNLEPKTWVHLHCRGGKGRSTSFLAMFDMLKNADQYPFEVFIDHQKRIPPYYDLSLIKTDDPLLIPCYLKRYQFLKLFHEFAIAHQQGKAASWSQWIAEKDAAQNIRQMGALK